MPAKNTVRTLCGGHKELIVLQQFQGAKSCTIVYSLATTSTANGIEAYEYLMLVLSMLPYLGKFPVPEELEKLMPWHPAVRHREQTKSE